MKICRFVTACLYSIFIAACGGGSSDSEVIADPVVDVNISPTGSIIVNPTQVIAATPTPVVLPTTAAITPVPTLLPSGTVIPTLVVVPTVAGEPTRVVTPTSFSTPQPSPSLITTPISTPTQTPTTSSTPLPEFDPPAITAGDDVDLTIGESYTLTARLLSAVDVRNPLEYQWTQVDGPKVQLFTPQSVQASFTSPDVSVITPLRFEVTVTDSLARTAMDSITVRVMPIVPIVTPEPSATTEPTTAPEPSVSGLDARISNTSCLAGPAPTTQSSSEYKEAFPELASFDSPVSFTQIPNSNSYWIVAERRGAIYRIENSPTVSARTLLVDLAPLLDEEHPETGVMSIVAHPQFSQNEFVFIYYFSQDELGNRIVVLERFKASSDLSSIDIDSRKRLFALDPPDDNPNHAGGKLIFGADGFLYLATGDGTGGNIPDPGNRSQNTKNLFGAMLRFDVNTADEVPYAIPSDNPFAANPLCNALGEADSAQDCPEVYAWGLRSPWRWSFDRDTNDLWLADVGYASFEEINIIKRGGNYGWKIFEGNQCMEEALCDDDSLIAPRYTFDRENFLSITGGYVYRGSQIADLRGRYVFADFIRGGIWTVEANDPEDQPVRLFDTGQNIASFAEDQEGELYYLNYTAGRIFRIQKNSSEFEVLAPQSLSETGCFNGAQPINAVIPYETRAPFWSDSATKTRAFALPDGEQISVNDNGDFLFPIGSVIIKNFFVQDRPIETRFLKYHDGGEWRGYTYEWNEAATDAFLVTGGKRVDLGGQEWIYPSEGQCFECHTDAANIVLGPEAIQLDFSYLYSSTLREANQLSTLHAIAAIDSLPAPELTLADPADSTQTLDSRARSYLHTNCSSCHRPGGPANVDIDFRYTTPFAEMALCNVSVKNDSLGQSDPKRLVPGSAAESLFIQRMDRLDDKRMPPLASTMIDQEGVRLLSDWVNSLQGCE